MTKFFNLTLLSIFFIGSAVYGQSIVHFQNWEGSVGDGNWMNETGGTNQWLRGTDATAVASGSKAVFISSDGSTYGYDGTVAEETYLYKDLTFPSDATLDIQVSFDWKCEGETGFDYMKVYIVDQSLGTPTESNIEAYGGFVYRLNSGGEFSNQSTFTTYTETLPTSVEGRADLRIVFTWTNDNTVKIGDPAAVDNIIVSLGSAPSSLSGEYLVGQAASAYFPTLTEAVYFLNSYGVSGDVTFSLTDALYDNTTEDFPVIINNFNSNPPSPLANSYSLTIKPAASVTTTISGSVDGDATVDGIYRGLFTLNEADNITIDGSNNGTTSRDLTISNTSTAEALSVFVASGDPNFNDNISIKNTIMETGYSAINNSAGVLVMDETYTFGAGGFSNVSIDNNQFLKGDYGIYIDGGSAGAINSISSISNNDMEQSGTNAIDYVGIKIRDVSSGTISGNTIGNFDDTDNEMDIGIYLATGATNVIVEKNDIHDISYSGTGGYTGIGIRIASATAGAGNIIRNNVIRGISGDGWDITSGYYDYNPFGILLSGTQTGMDIYNNSIYLTGNTLNQTNALSAGIALGSGSTADIRNNIIVNNLGLFASTGIGSMAIFAQTGNTQFEAIDYNNYYVNASGSGTNYIGRIASSNYSTLSTWKSASGSDYSSITADPGYTSATNLEPNAADPNSWHANGTGVQISSVTEDYLGNSRSTAVADGAPDMGAYEFTPTSTPVSATVSGSHTNSGTETFTVGGRVIAEITWGASGTLPTINALRYYSGANPPNAAPLTAQYFNSYVDISTTGGSGFTYDITLYYDEALLGTLSSEGDVRLSKNDGSGWTSFSSNTPDAVNNNVTVAGLSSFSTFTGSDIDNLLPVELTLFTGKSLSNKVLLSWETASEVNNEHFQVERSRNALEWSTIGTVAGNGTTNIAEKYTFTDKSPVQGTGFYRLRQVDYDGAYTYSKVIAVEITGEADENVISLYPNPAGSRLNINFVSSGESKMPVTVLDNAGRQVLTKEVWVHEGRNLLSLDITELRPGLYTIKLINNDCAIGLPFIKR